MQDTLGRPLHDLRISVTDRCNFRCTYCMPKDVFDREYEFLPHADLLTFEEIERLTRILVDRGVRKVRLTGGEPLLRRGIEDLVARFIAFHDDRHQSQCCCERGHQDRYESFHRPVYDRILE